MLLVLLSCNSLHKLDLVHLCIELFHTTVFKFSLIRFSNWLQGLGQGELLYPLLVLSNYQLCQNARWVVHSHQVHEAYMSTC